MHKLFSCITNLDKLTNFLLRVITNNKNQYISLPTIITLENLWRKQKLFYLLANKSFSSTSYWPMTGVLYCFQKCENLLESKYLAPSRGGHWGVPNTAIPKEKLWNTEIPCPKSTKYRYRIYDRSRFTSIYSHLACLPPIACMHQKSTSDIVRKYEKTLNWSLQGLKSSVITLTWKIFNFY